MSQPRWRSPGFRIALAVGVALLFVALPLADLSIRSQPASGPFASLVPTRLEARLGRGQLELHVTSLSVRHEAQLDALIDGAFAGQRATVAYQRGVLAPDRWIRVTKQALATVATLDSGSVTLQAKTLRLRGVTRDGEAFQRERLALIELLPPETTVRNDVGVIAALGDIGALCREAFRAFADVQVPFERASAELRTAAHGVLDKLVEFAFDCRDTTIVITGHTDAIGDDAWNLRLSLLRAAAVATYLVRAGVDPGRLEAYGAGSARPIADNDTAYGRSRNRRIEFSLR